MEKLYNVCVKDERFEWNEELSLDSDNPLQSVERMIDRFNKYLRPGENKRELIKIIGLVKGENHEGTINSNN